MTCPKCGGRLFRDAEPFCLACGWRQPATEADLARLSLPQGEHHASPRRLPGDPVMAISEQRRTRRLASKA